MIIAKKNVTNIATTVMSLESWPVRAMIKLKYNSCNLGPQRRQPYHRNEVVSQLQVLGAMAISGIVSGRYVRE